MSEVIFPTWIPDGTPASDDRLLFSDTSNSNAAFDAPVSSLPVSTATQTALDAKVDKTTTVNSKPLSSNVTLTALDVGALSDAPSDGKTYGRKNAAWAEVTGGSGSGGVVWPASATDNAIARFDTTTGKLIQNSSVTIDDTANVAGANEIHFLTSPTASAYAEGTLRWNTTDKTLDIEVGNNSTLQVGQEMFVRVRNSTGSTITNGSLVYVNGATWNRPTVALAKADAEATSHTLIGMATDDIANNADGFITVMGTVHDLDTSSYSDGQELFLSASAAGAFTATAPSSPNFVVKVGVVTRSHVTHGQILVQTQVRTVNASLIRGATLSGTNTGDQTITLTGDVTGSGTGSFATTLANTAVTAGSYTAANITVDAKGRITAAYNGSAGGSLWTSVTGTRTANTTFTLTGDQTATFKRGLVVKWTESSSVKCAMVVSSSFSSVTTVTIVGDAMASIDSSSLKYCATPAEKIKFATAGSIGTVASSVANAFYAFEDYRVLSADLSVGTAGTTNSTTVDINKNGTTMFATKPTLSSTVASSATPFTADSGTSLTIGDRVTIDVDAYQSTPATDLYVTLYVFPSRILNLS